jgi:hypothetical protein
MKKQVITYFFIAIFGLFLMPENSFAYAKKETMSCCKSKPTSEKSCCSKSKSSDKESGCNGKCNKNACTVNTSFAFAFISNFVSTESPVVWNTISERTTFSYPETSVSSGYYFIWSPPNIG